MTNEELAVQIKQGRSDLYVELWSQVHDFITYMALLRVCSVERPSEIDADDLIQSGYLALVDAVRAFDTERGAFTTVLGYHLKRAFNEACGTRTERAARDPIHRASSLDVPANTDDPDGESWVDLIPASECVEEIAVDNAYRERLREAEERLLSRLPEQSADIIRAKYLTGEPVEITAERHSTSVKNLSKLRSQYMTRLRSLARSTPEGAALQRYIEDSTDFYKGVGLMTFRETGISPIERKILDREQMEKAYRGCW